MDIRTTFDEAAGSWKITLSGEIDMYETPHFKERVSKALAQRGGDIWLDCHALTYIDSTGLGALVAIYKQAKAGGHALRVTGVKPQIAKIFRLTELDQLFLVEVES